MNWDLMFFLNSILFGIGLAMDAFSVSMANGLNEPEMPRRKAFLIAGTFALFQTLMPLLGWFLVRTVAETFTAFERFIPWIALILLLFIGGKMLAEGLRHSDEGDLKPAVGAGALFVQGIATSIDALSVGFTIEAYPFRMALAEALIIGAVTFGICVAGIAIGRRFGLKLKNKASVLGGIILILIGIEIFLKGIL